MAKLVLFGIGKIGQVVYHHFRTDSDYEIAGFATDRDFLPDDRRFEQLPVVAFDEVEQHFPPDSHALFVGIGYHQLNGLRAARCRQARDKGYSLARYVSSQNRHWLPEQIGDNCFVMSGEPLQPHAKIEEGCFIWSNATIGHHTQVDDYGWITSGAVIGGNCRIGRQCFIGLGATIGHEISIGDNSLIGAGTLITKDAPAESVFIAADTPRFRLNSAQFLKMGRL